MKDAIIFVLGCCAGAVIGNIVTSKKLNKKFDEHANEIIDEIVEKELNEYKKTHREKLNEVHLADKELIPEHEEVVNNGFVDYSRIKPTEEATGPAVLANEIDEPDDQPEEEMDVSGEPCVKNMVYEIGEDDFYDNKVWYDKRSLLYYPGNDVLVDEETEEICNTDVEGSDVEYLGDVWLDMISSNPPFNGNPGPIFIRNDEYSIDFQINIKEGNYDLE